jgi:hypothetical protein
VPVAILGFSSSARSALIKETLVEQRIYEGSVTPEALADYLVQQYDPKRDLQAQKIGQGESFIVQIGRGDQPEEIRHAVSVAVSRRPDGESGVAVAMGQQQWITPQMATHAVMFGLLGYLITPWILFALLGPISQLIGSTTLPPDIWNTIETYMASQAATLVRTEQLERPPTV